ncbi:MAG: alpha-galactosidase [Flavobacterium sp.]|jgi:alpha-galactosidase
MTNRMVLIGAGSAQFGFDMLGDIFQSTLLTEVHVVLHDINQEALDHVHKEAVNL